MSGLVAPQEPCGTALPGAGPESCSREQTCIQEWCLYSPGAGVSGCPRRLSQLLLARGHSHAPSQASCARLFALMESGAGSLLSGHRDSSFNTSMTSRSAATSEPRGIGGGSTRVPSTLGGTETDAMIELYFDVFSTTPSAAFGFSQHSLYVGEGTYRGKKMGVGL